MINTLLANMNSTVLITGIVCISFIIFVLLILLAIIEDYPARLQQVAAIIQGWQHPHQVHQSLTKKEEHHGK